MVLRAAVLLVTVLVACLLGAGVATAAPAAAVSAAPAAQKASTPTKSAPKKKASGVPCRSAVRACVRLSTNQAWLLDAGRVVAGPFRISHGRAGFRTPPGSFRVSYKDPDHFSNVYDAPMPYSVFFNGDIAFHQGSVRVTSHGCIHLPAGAARTFFGNLRPGDAVQVVT